MLQEVIEAPLKPYQRLELARDFLVPKLMHELVLGWNTIAKIYQKSGGLGIPSPGTMIPLLQKNTF